MPKKTISPRQRQVNKTGKALSKIFHKSMAAEGAVKLKQFASYVNALYGISIPAQQRAESPFSSHPWVYAGAMAIAVTAGQAPFTIYRETDKQQQSRITKCLDSGHKWSGFPAGTRRMAVKRHLANIHPRSWGMKFKALEPDEQHPLNEVFNNPNDMMSGTSLWQATALFQVLRGSCFWVMFGPDGSTLQQGDDPVEIWPMPPELFEPVWGDNRLVGWRWRPTKGTGRSDGINIILQPHEVIEFKYINPDPNNFFGGFAPITAVAGSINLDLLADELNRSTITNGSDPGGILVSDRDFANDDEERKALKKFEQRHKGAQNKRRLAILSGGLKYISTGLSNAEMEYGAMKDKHRDEVLACMGVPKVVCSITDSINYATARTQLKLFWQGRLIPMIRGWEDELDRKIFHKDNDITVGGFDLSQVDALRDGLAEAVASASATCGIGLHTPPRVALELHGIEVEDYEGIDECLIPAGNVTYKDAITQSSLGNEPQQPPDTSPPPEGGLSKAPSNDVTNEPATGKLKSIVTVRRVPSILLTAVTKASSNKRMEQWAHMVRKIHGPKEVSMSLRWRTFIARAKKQNLTLFDKVVHGRKLKSMMLVLKGSSTNPEDMAINTADMKDILRPLTRPVYTGTLQDVVAYTNDELGGAQFDLHDPAIQKCLEDRQRTLMGSAPDTLRSNVVQSLQQGLDQGETVNELRQRIADVYDMAADSPKTLQVARTEVSGIVNSVRDTMFDLQGVENQLWVTAGDEKVRETHDIYGSSGAKPRGFNWMELGDDPGDGTLTYPGDLDAPPEEIIACRCICVPA